MPLMLPSTFDEELRNKGLPGAAMNLNESNCSLGTVQNTKLHVLVDKETEKWGREWTYVLAEYLVSKGSSLVWIL